MPVFQSDHIFAPSQFTGLKIPRADNLLTRLASEHPTLIAGLDLDV